MTGAFKPPTTAQVAEQIADGAFKGAPAPKLSLSRADLFDLLERAAALAVALEAQVAFTPKRPAIVISRFYRDAELWRRERGLELRAFLHVGPGKFDRLRGRDLERSQVVQLNYYGTLEERAILESCFRRSDQ